MVRTIKQKVPVPVFEQNEAFNLYRTTGLTPRLLTERKNSWTVRAAIGRATGFRVDSSLCAPRELMSSLMTAPPEALLAEEREAQQIEEEENDQLLLSKSLGAL